MISKNGDGGSRTNLSS